MLDRDFLAATVWGLFLSIVHTLSPQTSDKVFSEMTRLNTLLSIKLILAISSAVTVC